MAAGTEILISFAKLLGDTEKVWTIQRGGMRCKHHDDDDSFFADMLLLVLLLYPLAALLYHLPIPSKLYRPSLSPHLTALNPALLNFSISTHYVIKEHTHNILGHHIWGWWWWRWWAEQKQNRNRPVAVAIGWIIGLSIHLLYCWPQTDGPTDSKRDTKPMPLLLFGKRPKLRDLPTSATEALRRKVLLYNRFADTPFGHKLLPRRTSVHHPPTPHGLTIPDSAVILI